MDYLERATIALSTATAIEKTHKLTPQQRKVLAHMLDRNTPAGAEWSGGVQLATMQQSDEVARRVGYVNRLTFATLTAMRRKGVLVCADASRSQMPHGGPAHFSARFVVNPALLPMAQQEIVQC